MKSLAILFTLSLLAATLPGQQQHSSTTHTGGPSHPGRASGSSHEKYARSRQINVYAAAVPVAAYVENQPAPPPEVVEQPLDPALDPNSYPNAAQPANDFTPRVVQAPAPTPQEWAMSEGRYYLIAAKDHSVYTALAYWMEGGALHYVTPENAHSQITLDLLDLDLTKKLNAGRGLGFNLKP